MIYVGLESMLSLQGVRTTLCFLSVSIFASVGMLKGVIASTDYLDFMKWLFGLYVGAKSIYKGTEIMKAKNAEKG